jgi:hypothetical protein
MASTRYLDSAAGNDTNNGTTWALAKATMAGIDGIDTSGDTIYVAQTHSESTASALSFAIAGTLASPTRIICGDKSAQPPTALSTAGVIATTGNSSISVTATSAYVYGLTFDAGQAASGTASMTAAAGSSLVTYESCTFKISSTGASSLMNLVTNGFVQYRNCSFKFGAAGQTIASNGGNGGHLAIRGGSVLSGGTSPTALFTPISGSNFEIEGFDMSNLSSSANLSSTTSANLSLRFRNCKLPASWTGSLNASTPGAGSNFEMFNCDSGDTHYRYRKATQFGTIQDESTLVRSGGANDGVTTFSYKMVSNANCQLVAQTLDTPEFVIYIPPASTGSAQTATVSILRDSATNLKDNEVWLEGMYLGTSGVPLASLIDDAASSLPIAAGADQAADSGSTWTTTGMSNPNKQKCNFTFTPQEEGYLHVRVRLAKPSTTLYVDPLIQKTW